MLYSQSVIRQRVARVHARTRDLFLVLKMCLCSVSCATIANNEILRPVLFSKLAENSRNRENIALLGWIYQEKVQL